MSRELKVALAHDWLNGMRGGERCLDLICKEFPKAEIYTLLYRPEQVSEAIRNRPVHVSGLQRVPGFRSRTCPTRARHSRSPIWWRGRCMAESHRGLARR